MTNRRAWRCVFAVAAATGLIASGCNSQIDLNPPQIRYGEQECELCRMIISEERFAAGLVQIRDGRAVKLAFDDVGCLLEYFREHRCDDEEKRTPYVHDITSREWLDARQAVFVRSETLTTPMASCLAACASEDAAEQFRRAYPGALVRFKELLSPMSKRPMP